MVDNLKIALQECNQTCKELSTLLEQENISLQQRKDIKVVENNVKTKKVLTVQLERFVGIIKDNFEVIRTNVDMVRDLNIFKKLIEGYKALAERNAMLLRAAYNATSIVLESIKKQTARPVVRTYNAYGQMQEKVDTGASLINYSV